jgi:Flp pilus assembly protein TadG
MLLASLGAGMRERLLTIIHRGILGRCWRETRGNAALEMALVAPMLVLMMIGVADFGMAVFLKMQVQQAAQAGAEYAIVHGFDAAAITTAATSAVPVSGITATPAPAQSCGCPSGTTMTAATCGTNCANGLGAGTYVTVSTQGTYATMLAYPGMPASFAFTAASIVRVQ